MEFDREKSFGHPVLRPVFADEKINDMDFPRAQFEPVLSLEVSVDNPTQGLLGYEFTVSVPEMVQHIKNENLAVIMEIRCRKTFYSKVIKIDGDTFEEGQTTIDLTQLRDVIEVHPFIIAMEDFEFKSTFIHEDFGYDAFPLSRGSIVAWHPPMPFSIERDQYRSVRSIIDFQPDENVPYGDYVVGVEQQYATVRANPKFIENCKVAESVPQAQVGLLASFYIPVVGELFINLAKEPEKANELRWASILKAKADELGIDWQNEILVMQNAQKILQKPLQAFSKNRFQSQ